MEREIFIFVLFCLYIDIILYEMKVNKWIYDDLVVDLIIWVRKLFFLNVEWYKIYKEWI